MFCRYLPETKDLLQSLVPVMVLDEILIGFTGFTGPCSGLDIVDVILGSAGSFRESIDLLESLVPVMVSEQNMIGFTGFTGPCSVFGFGDVVKCSWMSVGAPEEPQRIHRFTGFTGPCNGFKAKHDWIDWIHWSL